MTIPRWFSGHDPSATLKLIVASTTNFRKSDEETVLHIGESAGQKLDFMMMMFCKAREPDAIVNDRDTMHN